MNYNVKAFKELIVKYRSITKEDIEDIRENSLRLPYYYNILRNLTGFGNIWSCTLCKEARNLVINEEDDLCNYCLHAFKTHNDAPCTEHETYNVFTKEFTTVEDLLLLIAKRADYLESIVKKYEEEMLKDM